MTTTTAKLAAGKLNDDKGIPDETADQMFAKLGSKHMAIVELEPFERTDGIAETNHVVRLRVVHLELADNDTAAFLRDLSRALYQARQPPSLDGIDDESVDDAVRRGQNALPVLNDDLVTTP